MALNDISLLNTLLQQRANEFKSIFDAGIATCFSALNSEITALMANPISSEPNSNSHILAMAKWGISANMKVLYEGLEKDWMLHLAKLKAHFMEDLHLFLELEGKLPVLQDLPRSGEDGASSSQYVMPQNSTQTISSMLRSCHMETDEAQSSRNQQLNLYENPGPSQNFIQAIEQSPVITPNNATTNSLNGSTAVSIHYAANSLQNTPEKDYRNLNPTFSSQPATSQHSPKQKFVCLYCTKTFLHQSELKRHEPTHTGEKNFSCQYCSKKYTTQGALHNHQHLRCKNRPQ